MTPLPSENLRVNIRLFGPVQLNYEGQPPIHFRSNPERALLTYLAIESGRPSNRESIYGLIWPNLSESQARNNLRVTLSRLRRSLRGNMEIIRVSGKSIELNAKADISIDTHTFKAVLETSRKHPHPPKRDCMECIERYRQAADLIRGEFAEGLVLDQNIPFMEWLVLKRERMHREALVLLHTLADYHLRRGELRQATNFSHRQLELEPWREEAHRQMMTILAHGDQKSAALAQFEKCKQVLEDELGVDPSAETLVLYNRIKKSRGRKRPALPATMTRFVGRKQKQAEIIQALSEPACRLLTLIGMGGMGKTRLAAQIAAQFEYAFMDGTIFIPLTTIQTPDRIPNAIADALGFSFAGSGEPIDQLLNYLENREYLIVLDNFEHLLEAAPMLAQIWERCPGIKLLVTSRERLGLEEEYLVELEGLPASQITDPAVNLLLGCIYKVEPSFDPSKLELEKIVELCSQVEGMPLALELVAPMTRVLSIQEIINDIPLLELSSLDAVFERSWVMLTPAERTGFMQLAIFNTPFTHQTARELAQIDLAMFTGLVDKSLIQRNTSFTVMEDVRDKVYFDFHPLLRQFAYQKLNSEPLVFERVQESHADYFLNFLENVYESILTPEESPVIKIVHARHEDFVTAMKWGCNHGRYESVRKGLQIYIHYFESYSAFQTAEKFYGEIIQILKEVQRQERQPFVELNQVLARAIWYYGWQKMHFREYEAAIKHENEAVRLAREAHDGSVEVGALNAIGVILGQAGDLDQSNQYLYSALEVARKTEECLEDRWQIAGVNSNLGRNAMGQSKLDLARAYYDTAMQIYRDIGHYWGIANVFHSLGKLFILMSEFEEARASLKEGLKLAETHNYQWVRIRNLVILGDLALKQEDWKSAVRYYQESLDLIEGSGEKNILEEVREKLKQAKTRIHAIAFSGDEKQKI